MTKFDSMDFIDPEGFEGLEGRQGRADRPKKVKRTLDSNTVSPEEVIDSSLNMDNLNPEEIFMLKEEGKIIDSGLQPDKNKEIPNIAEFELDSDDEILNFGNDGIHNEKAPVTTDEVVSELKEKALAKKGVSKKDVNSYYDDYGYKQSNGKRGKEPKGKFKKGLESIKRLLKIK